MQVDDVVGKEFARLVDHRDLAAGAHAGVDSQHGDGSRRRRQQQVVQIVAENLNRFAIGALLHFQADFGLNRRVQQALPGVFDGEFKLRRPIARGAQNAGLQAWIRRATDPAR